MDRTQIEALLGDLMIVLGAGLISGLLCRRFGISQLIGYLVVGALIGNGGLGLVAHQTHELEVLAEMGALFLLFAVGIEFSLDELLRLKRYFLVGGSLQMLLVAVPLTFVCRFFGMSWNVAVLAGTAGALSSTVLVFKTLSEHGEAASPHGRRAVAILLFQDVALVPLLLLVPLLTGRGEGPTPTIYILLTLKSLLFVVSVLTIREVLARWFIPMLIRLRSVELVVLFAVALLGMIGLAAVKLGLPSAIGALAAGLALSGQRLSKQVDVILLPFRETFSAVFFVSLGMLLHPLDFFEEPVLLTGGLLGMLLLKTGAAALALRTVGLAWPVAWGMGMGLAQLGEFSFLVISQAAQQGLLSRVDYNRMLFVALGTLLATPQMLRWGLRSAAQPAGSGADADLPSGPYRETAGRALVVGAGPIGRRVASLLETSGTEVCVLDLSPVNLYPFGQAGFTTIAGDGRDPEVLYRAGIDHCRLAVVSVPDDEVALQVIRSMKTAFSALTVLVRCRFESNVGTLLRAGAAAVVSEEVEASGRLMALCEKLVRAQREGTP